jgi:hypothetical protein
MEFQQIVLADRKSVRQDECNHRSGGDYEPLVC